MDKLSTTPEGFLQLKKGSTVVLAKRDGAEDIAAALVQGVRCVPLKAVGRGTMYKFPWRPGRIGILRKCRRGGLMHFLLGERYVLRNRPLREFTSHLAVLEQGLPAPNLLGVCWTRRGIFYTGSLATEELKGSDLHTWLTEKKNFPETEEVLLACGQMIRDYHDAGIEHADLQVKNIFVCETHPALLDFDGVRVGAPLHPFRRNCNLLRLRRSFDKRGHRRQLFDLLMAGYGEVGFPWWLDRLYGVRGFFSDIMFGRRPQ